MSVISSFLKSPLMIRNNSTWLDMNIIINPFFLFSISFVIALVYSVLPTNNPAQLIIRACWWDITGVIATVELLCICLPGISDSEYILSYFLGYIIAPLINIASFATSLNSNVYITTISITSSTVLPSIIFFRYACMMYQEYQRLCSDGKQHPQLDQTTTIKSMVMEASGEIPSRSENTTTSDNGRSTRGASMVFNQWPEDFRSTILNHPHIPYDLFSSSIPYEEPIEVNEMHDTLSKSSSNNNSFSNSNGYSLWKSWREKSTKQETITTTTLVDAGEEELAIGEIPKVVSVKNMNGKDVANNTDEMSEGNQFSIPTTKSAINPMQRHTSKAFSDETRQMPMNSRFIDGVPTNTVSANESSAIYPWHSYSWSRKLFCFLPRFWISNIVVLSTTSNSTSGTTAVLTGNPLVQFALAVLYLLLYNGYYDTLCLFTYYFRSHQGAKTRLGLFFVFIMMGLGFRLAMKRVGLALDRRKRGTASMYFVGELMALFFYYTFYRVLFESVTNWIVFLLFQLLHVVSEWIMYPLRGSSFIFNLFSSWETRYSILNGALLPADLNQHDFQGLLALDFAIRCVVMLGASVGIMLLLVVIDYCPWIDSNLKQTGASRTNTMLLIIVSVGFEACNAIAINSYYFIPLQMKLISKVKNCFRTRFFALVTVAIAANLYINPIFALSSKK